MNPLTIPASGAVHVDITVAVADIRVRERSEEVSLHITGEREPGDVTVDYSTDANGTLRVTVSERRRRAVSWRRRRGLVIELATPPRTSLTVDGAAADLRADGPLGSLRFATAAGDTRLGHVSGDVHIKGATGDVHVNTVGGELRVQLATGNVVAGQVAAGADLRTASGHVTIRDLRGVSSVNSVSGDVSVTSAGTGALSVQVLSGDVSIGIAPGVSSALDVSTLSGKTTSELPVTPTPVEASSLRLDLTVSTVSGDVRVHRATKEAA